MDQVGIRKIIHIDMDTFYASVEHATIRPSRASRWRSAIRPNAASLLLRATRREVSEFARRCRRPSRFGSAPVPPRFDVYREVSKQVQAIFKDYTPLVEPLSLDEAYLDVTDNLRGIPTAWETAKEIRARIYEETKLTASAGISCSKFLAKLASDYRKPNGQFGDHARPSGSLCRDPASSEIPRRSPKTTVKMRARGIETGVDLRRHTLDFLQSHFGKVGRNKDRRFQFL